MFCNLFFGNMCFGPSVICQYTEEEKFDCFL